MDNTIPSAPIANYELFYNIEAEHQDINIINESNSQNQIQNQRPSLHTKANTNTKSQYYQPVISLWSNLSDDEFYLSFIKFEEKR